MKTYSLKIYDVQFERLLALHAEKKRIHNFPKFGEGAQLSDAVRVVQINSEIAGIVGAYLDDFEGERGE